MTPRKVSGRDIFHLNILPFPSLSPCQMLVLRTLGCVSCWQLIQTQWLLWRENIKSKLLLISPLLLFQYCREQSDPWPLARPVKINEVVTPALSSPGCSPLTMLTQQTSHSYTVVNTKLSNKIQRKNYQNEWSSHTKTEYPILVWVEKDLFVMCY